MSTGQFRPPEITMDVANTFEAHVRNYAERSIAGLIERGVVPAQPIPAWEELPPESRDIFTWVVISFAICCEPHDIEAVRAAVSELICRLGCDGDPAPLVDRLMSSPHAPLWAMPKIN